MAQNPRRRNAVIVVLLLLLLVVLFFLYRCNRPASPSPAPPQPASVSPGDPPPAAAPAPPPAAAAPQPEERLTPATLTVPEQVPAGATFTVRWTGPDNPGDYVNIVAKDAAPNTAGHYRETQHGPALELTAPIQPGPCEVRYVTGRSRTILGRAPVEVLPTTATLSGPTEVTLGSNFTVAWTGPNNPGDYVTIVAKDALDAHFGSYADTSKGASVTLTAPPTPGDFELRYVTGQARKVLARREIKVIAAVVTLDGPSEAVAGSTIQVAWTGPNNAGDYITVVAKEVPEGQYGNYTNTSTGSPLKLLLPILSGPAELRYMTGQGNKVLARRPITINAAPVTLSAPERAAPDSAVPITWTGPNHPGDYITIVPKALPDGQYAKYTNTTAGSPLHVTAPKEPGDCEVRYMTGQGNKVLARIAIRIGT